MDGHMNVQRAIRQQLADLVRSGVTHLPIGEATATVIQAVTTESSESARETSPPLEQQSILGQRPTSATTAELTATEQSSSCDTENLSTDVRREQLAILASKVAVCESCAELCSTRKQTVFGVGTVTPRLCFFGEAPGADEDRLGEPFVGRAGQLLDRILAACTLKREDVYILNVLKCRPPSNRNPLPEEIENCRPYFERQLEILQPEYICCLGSFAATTLLNTSDSVGRLRGKFHVWRGIPVMATYHPAYLLRYESAKKKVWEDMQMLMKEMGIEIPKKKG